MTTEKIQSEKFKEAARALECDDDPAHVRDRLGKLVKHKPVEKAGGQMIDGSCHCGGVRLRVVDSPAWVGRCNCSLCRKLAWLVAYYPPSDVSVEGPTTAYVWGDRMIGIHHCPVCGCGTHWESLGEDFGRVGVNARLLDGFDEAVAEVRLLDNAD